MEEVWKDIPGYEGYYQVSNLGRVKGVERISHINHHIIKEKILCNTLNHKGYKLCYLCKKGITRAFAIHRLVYISFNGPIPEGKVVNHIDENKLNNSLSNLNLLTPKENANWGTAIQRRVKKRKENNAY